MSEYRLGEVPYTDLVEIDRSRAVAILPIGAVEAHGPHLPLVTDGVISSGMAERGCSKLRAEGVEAWVLPSLHYTAAPFAEAFPGTISLRPETFRATLHDVGVSLAGSGWGTLALVNSHLDPAHLGSLYAAVRSLGEAVPGLEVVFPDITRKPWALRLTDEFKSGACHAGRYESSLVMALQPAWVREDERMRLEANPQSLSVAIGQGQKTFEAAGGPRAYFGDPAAASVEEGERTFEVLGSILAEAVLATR